MKKLIALLTVGVLVLPASLYAASEFRKLPETLTTGAPALLVILDNITNWVFTIFMVLAVIFVTLAAYKYLMSGGGEEVGKAHKMLMYAAVAVAVAVLAKGIVVVAEKLVTPSAPTTSATSTTP